MSVVARPDVGPQAPWRLEPPRELVLDNGIRVLHHDMPGQYVVSVRLVVPLSLDMEVSQLIEALAVEELETDVVQEPA